MKHPLLMRTFALALMVLTITSASYAMRSDDPLTNIVTRPQETVVTTMPSDPKPAPTMQPRYRRVLSALNPMRLFKKNTDPQQSQADPTPMPASSMR